MIESVPEVKPKPDPVGWTEALGGAASNPPTPRTSGEVLFALEKEWTVSSFENRLKAQFEQWVRRNAKRAIAETEMDDGPEEADKFRTAYVAAVGAGNYTWDGRACRAARSDIAGIQQILFLALRRCQPDVTEAQVTAMFREAPRDCGLAVRWALGNSSTPAAQAGDNGNGKATKPATLDGP